MTTAGLVGHAQSLSRTLAAEVALFELRRQQPMTVKGAATLTANILSGALTGCNSSSLVLTTTVATCIPSTLPAVPFPTLIVLPAPVRHTCGVLEDGFKENMSQAEALKLAARASMHRDSVMRPPATAWIWPSSRRVPATNKSRKTRLPNF